MPRNFNLWSLTSIAGGAGEEDRASVQRAVQWRCARLTLSVKRWGSEAEADFWCMSRTGPVDRIWAGMRGRVELADERTWPQAAQFVSRRGEPLPHGRSKA